MLDKLQGFVKRLETLLLGILFLSMMGVAVYQVLARNLVGGGLLWGDELVRSSVLWVTMVGAAVASGTDGHIRIDIIGRFAGPVTTRWITRLTSLFTAFLCAVLGWYSITFIQGDYADSTPGIGAVSAWIVELVIPVAAAVMALRYAIQVVKPVEP